MGAEPVPRREVVTGGPRTVRTGRAGRTPPRPATAPAPRPAPGDDTAVTHLMRRQIRTGFTVTALLAALLGSLPVVLRLLPATSARPDAPLAVWLVLGVAPYPALLGIGAWYVRRAERAEGDVTAR
ncbi:hypothetical protein QQY24_04400 [Streptomyces sp. TG1A-8]|uniref:hypothetical protein n=1 Tax=Streptomyces sp. TG1A-8 TaxID=3051385 RepID=UPI00265C54A4|nr:hypothetical protein [Streptomyces sp. TG1A-8]MDO0924694.1 hypothetical protein [Streptomyces sp. TG1A-8]